MNKWRKAAYPMVQRKGGEGKGGKRKIKKIQIGGEGEGEKKEGKRRCGSPGFEPWRSVPPGMQLMDNFFFFFFFFFLGGGGGGERRKEG